MLGYQHAYHAGNRADIHKHAAFALVLQHLRRKEKPFCVIDTHAGRGLYPLDSPEATKTGEHREGVVRLWAEASTLPPSLTPWLEAVRASNPPGELSVYPGSPEMARRALRPQDRLILCELHPGERERLRRALPSDRRLHIHARDGFEALPALVPPAERRGVVLVDPSYEIKDDYRSVVRSVIRADRKWPIGIYLVWYAILAEERHRALQKELAILSPRASPAKILVDELTWPGVGFGRGLRGSGLLIVNPPHGLEEALEQAGKTLAERLFPEGGSSHRLELLTET